MTGIIKGCVPLAVQKNPYIIVTDCFLHRVALAAKTVLPELKTVLDLDVKIVNYMNITLLKFLQFAKLSEYGSKPRNISRAYICMIFVTRKRLLSFLPSKRRDAAFCLQGSLNDFVRCQR
ncbi:hypothetical protein RF11_08279 [Thelohanellus kitauei]|uniref:Zinc finger BED domain-containing protein 5 n=1 Tax=Thelohanellus kitauei TaxID=669202 RepID=A0A0C2IR68_THEKT|nr:hypothetical protein RF11_08279 [Thelohanellus kitauei]